MLRNDKYCQKINTSDCIWKHGVGYNNETIASESFRNKKIRKTIRKKTKQKTTGISADNQLFGVNEKIVFLYSTTKFEESSELQEDYFKLISQPKILKISIEFGTSFCVPDKQKHENKFYENSKNINQTRAYNCGDSHTPSKFDSLICFYFSTFFEKKNVLKNVNDFATFYCDSGCKMQNALSRSRRKIKSHRYTFFARFFVIKNSRLTIIRKNCVLKRFTDVLF